jgi:hypothetical protein
MLVVVYLCNHIRMSANICKDVISWNHSRVTKGHNIDGRQFNKLCVTKSIYHMQRTLHM